MHRIYLAATMGYGLGSDDPEELAYYKKLRKEMEDMNHTTEQWYFERHINTFCKDPKSIWHMQIGCESTGEYSQIFSSEDESLNAIKNNQIIWSAYYPICNSELDY